MRSKMWAFMTYPFPNFNDFEDEGFRPTLYDGYDYLTIY